MAYRMGEYDSLNKYISSSIAIIVYCNGDEKRFDRDLVVQELFGSVLVWNIISPCTIQRRGRDVFIHQTGDNISLIDEKRHINNSIYESVKFYEKCSNIFSSVVQSYL